MGYRVHVVKQTEKFADIEAFNWKNQEFAELLDTLGCDVNGNDSYERFECKKDYFITAINLVKCYIGKGTINLPQEELEKFGISNETYKELFEEYGIDPDWVDEALSETDKTIGCTKEELLSIMLAFLGASDPDSDWIIFVAW